MWGVFNLEHLEVRGNRLQNLDDLDVYGTPVPTKAGSLGKLKHLDISSNDLAPSTALFSTLLVLPVSTLLVADNPRLLTMGPEEEKISSSHATRSSAAAAPLKAQESLTNLCLKRTGATVFPAVMLRGRSDPPASPPTMDEAGSVWALKAFDLSYNNLKTVPALFLSLSTALTELNFRQVPTSLSSRFCCRISS